MHQSYKRQTEFEQFQIFFDLKPNKMLQPSQTSWLSIVATVKRVLVLVSVRGFEIILHIEEFRERKIGLPCM